MIEYIRNNCFVIIGVWRDNAWGTYVYRYYCTYWVGLCVQLRFAVQFSSAFLKNWKHFLWVSERYTVNLFHMLARDRGFMLFDCLGEDGVQCNRYNPHRTNHIWNCTQRMGDWLKRVSLASCILSFSSLLRLFKTGCRLVPIFRPRSFSCYLAVSADFWSLNGKVIVTVLYPHQLQSQFYDGLGSHFHGSLIFFNF